MQKINKRMTHVRGDDLLQGHSTAEVDGRSDDTGISNWTISVSWLLVMYYHFYCFL